MNSEDLGKKLLAAARVEASQDHVPVAFEQRVMARLHSRPKVDPVTLWSRALWRAAMACLVVPLLLGVWAASSPRVSGAETSLSQAFEDTVYAPVQQELGDLGEW